jgi:hypothetical protein
MLGLWPSGFGVGEGGWGCLGLGGSGRALRDAHIPKSRYGAPGKLVCSLRIFLRPLSLPDRKRRCFMHMRMKVRVLWVRLAIKIAVRSVTTNQNDGIFGVWGIVLESDRKILGIDRALTGKGTKLFAAAIGGL